MFVHQCYHTFPTHFLLILIFILCTLSEWKVVGSIPDEQRLFTSLTHVGKLSLPVWPPMLRKILFTFTKYGYKRTKIVRNFIEIVYAVDFFFQKSNLQKFKKKCKFDAFRMFLISQLRKHKQQSEKFLNLGTLTWRGADIWVRWFLYAVSRDFEVGKSWSYIWLSAGLTTKVRV